MELNDKERLDRWLDGALQQYGNAEPRAGLERRILANMESAPQTGIIGRRWWAFAAAVLIASITAAVWLGNGVNFATKRSVAKVTPAANAGAIAKPSKPDPTSAQVATPVSHHARRRVSRPGIEAATEPRLEQFPSARPLSEQEQMLARYVRESPQEAVLVAQVQAERQNELEKLVADESSN